MDLFFVAAANQQPLTKQFTKTPSGIETTTYPQVKQFHSFKVSDVNDAGTFYAAVRAHSEQGHALVKGTLSRTLRGESRAGSTSPGALCRWLCLDLDFHQGFQDVDHFLYELYPPLEHVSYVFQHSASAGVKGPVGLRGHLFMLLEEPLDPQLVKRWLMHRNLHMEQLRSQVRLTASGLALHYPLDITTCQNDKLLYIAPPEFKGMDDPIDERLVLVEKSKQAATLKIEGITDAKLRADVLDAIHSLRTASDMEYKEPQYKKQGVLQLLKNPDPATVTGVQHARGFVYLNLNDGDSWGYYHNDVENPNLLYNFKGEPVTHLRDIVPDYYKSFVKQKLGVPEQIKPIVFRETSSDTYYNALVDTANREIKLLAKVSSKDRLKDFLANHGETLPSPIPEWTIGFDPQSQVLVDFDNRYINMYQPTVYQRQAPSVQSTIPPVIDKVITSVCVDQQTKDYFINWLAYIYQTRQKTHTGWIFQGTQGTGKGLLFWHIIRPLLGEEHCIQVMMHHFEDNFNAYLERCIVLMVDEANLNPNDRRSQRVLDKLKNMITEDHHVVRAMRQDPRSVPSYTNIIFASNLAEIVPLERADRRINVAPRQESSLLVAADEIGAIQSELHAFSDYLKNYVVNVDHVGRVVENEPRARLIELSTTTVENFFQAIQKGDLEYFVSYMSSRPPLSPNNSYVDFDRAVRRWAANVGTKISVERNELMAVYQYLQGTAMSPTKFSRLASLHGVNVQPVRIDERVSRGTYVTWQAADDIVASLLMKNDNIRRIK